MENTSIYKKIKHLHLTIYMLANNLKKLHKIIYSKNKRLNKQLYNILFVFGLKRPILYKMDHIYDKSENIPQQWEDLASLQLPALLGGRRIVSGAKRDYLQFINLQFIRSHPQKNIINIEARRFANAAGGYSAAENLSPKSLICQNGSSTTQNKYRNIQKKTALMGGWGAASNKSTIYKPPPTDKFINHIMINGKKSTALNILYTALQLLVCKTAWGTEMHKNEASPNKLGGVSTNYKRSGIKPPLPNTLIKTPLCSIFCFTSLVPIKEAKQLLTDSDKMTPISKPQKQVLSFCFVGATCSVSKTNLPQKRLQFNINQYSKTLFRNVGGYAPHPPHLPQKKTSTISISSYKKQMIANLLEPKKSKGFFTAKAIYKFISKKLWQRSLTDKYWIYEQSMTNVCPPTKMGLDSVATNKSVSSCLASLICSADKSMGNYTYKSMIYNSSYNPYISKRRCYYKKYDAPRFDKYKRDYLATEDLLETGPQGDKNRRLIIEELLFSKNNSSSIMMETNISDISQSHKMSIDLIQKAIENVKPWIEVRKVKKRGIVYLVPAFVQPHRQETLAIRWILEAARKRKKNKSNFLRGGINQHGSYNLESDLMGSEYKAGELTNSWKTFNYSHKTNPILQRQEDPIPKLVNMGQNQFINAEGGGLRPPHSNTKLCSFFESLAAELFDASKKQGKARQKRDEMHKVSLASRVNLRFRWWKR